MIEDEKYMAEAIEQILKKNNYSVDLAFDGEHGLDFALSGIYDIIILDIMLPKKDGITLLKELRKSGIKTPVILLIAKGDVNHKVHGLDSGADDYLAKPFQTEELLARLRALGRRTGEFYNDHILRFEELEYNPFTLELRSRDKFFKLTLKEGQLMELLLKHKTNILPTDTIIEKIWGFDCDAEDRHVQVYISFLRKKLKQLDSTVKIKAIRGAGYILEKNEGVNNDV